MNLMEVKNKLLNYNAVIYQNDDWFKFSLDSVLLANFVSINYRIKNILDIATGNAPIPMLLTYRTKVKIYGVEVQKEVYRLALKSVAENKMENQIKLINDNIKNYHLYFKNEHFDVITTNPPYFELNNVRLVNNNSIKSIARHEVLIKLEEIIEISSNLLKKGGIFAIVHRPERFMEIIDCMKKYNIEPKKIQFVYTNQKKDAKIVLIEGIKYGNKGVKINKPLYIYKENGEYTQEARNMFGECNDVAK